MASIAVIYGSSRPSKNGEFVAKWFVNEIKDRKGLDFDFIDLKEENLPMLAEPVPAMFQKYELPETNAWSEKISGYDGFIFAVAEYNLSVAPILKNSIDHLFHEWAEKPVAFISYGSYPKSSAVEHMRTIMSPFKTKQVDETLHVTPAHEAIDEDGNIDASKVNGNKPAEIIDSLAGLFD